MLVQFIATESIHEPLRSLTVATMITEQRLLEGVIAHLDIILAPLRDVQVRLLSRGLRLLEGRNRHFRFLIRFNYNL